jgi:hypothetical protein
MSSCVEDLQMLRLMKAFQKLKNPNVRRSIILCAEPQVEEEQKKLIERTDEAQRLS